MKCLIMVNGLYGSLKGYKEIVKEADILLCVDGGANYAYEMDLRPDFIIGDMDSILPHVYHHYAALGVKFIKYPEKKDYTDTQLAISLADEMGADAITFLGSMGKRLDHMLANIYCGMEYCEKGIRIEHYEPELSVYLVKDQLKLSGSIGDKVSVLALTKEAAGVFEAGFEFPLNNAVLYKNNPYAISNLMLFEEALIEVKEGIILVFHYRQKI